MIVEVLTDSVEEVPTRLLGDSQIPVQLHARDALQVRRHHVNRDHPSLAAERGTVHQAVRLDREIASAVAAAVRLRLASLALLDIVRSALWASNTIRPSLLDKPSFRRFVVWKHSEKLRYGQAVAVGLSRCPVCFLFPHDGSSLPKSRKVVKC